MEFCEIRLNSIPTIQFACEVETTNYKNRFANHEKLLEISLCEEGDILYRHSDGREETVLPGMLSPIVKDMNCVTSAESGVRQWHITVGVFATYDLCRHGHMTDEVKARAAEGETFLIPYHQMLGSETPSVRQQIRKIIRYQTATDPASKQRALAEWFSLASALTEFTLRLSENEHVPPALSAYADRAERYIREHYREKIAVSDIASYLGISEGYLHSVFRTLGKKSVSETVNAYRIEVARQYIAHGAMPLKDIASQIGIDDPEYLSRLFKKVTGMSYRQYCKKK